MSVFTLYRFYDTDDVLLYVGLSINPGRRFERHKSDKPWWKEVARIEMEQYPDHVTLRAAERDAITEEKPRYNIRMNEQRPPDALVWRCEICRGSISDDEGYITVSYADIEDHRRALAELEKWKDSERERTGTNLVATPLTAFPDYVRWHVFHGRCDPSPKSVDYWIGVERARTPRELLGWSAHLLEKRWLPTTNWSHVIRSQIGDAAWL